MDDRGLNIAERSETLRAQQRQLVDGRRLAQMFPVGTKELDCPKGFSRVVTSRGVFHFNPQRITKELVVKFSAAKRENILLGFGPYNKQDVLEYVGKGEIAFAITERTPEGVEVKAVVGTESTLPEQLEELEQIKTPGNVIGVEAITKVLLGRLGG